ncbi:MAG: 2-oxoacid:acceptor oxidoreductase family protein [Actinomycetes bacterium]|jgi:2-oxoglutarate ferredoxin oxidoreductase subunit gamma|nr:2-oxoacid:acceptor oxidoreductase family protein [Actinomycetes bacterium]
MSDIRSEIRLLLAGFGGQGILFAGKVVAYAGLIEDRELSWLPSYGPEMRGGTANCSVTLASSPIGSPLVTEPDVLVAMNRPSLEKYAPIVRPGGVIVYDSSLIDTMPVRDDVQIYDVPATGITSEQDLGGLANVLMVGKLWRETQFCAEDTLTAALEKAIPARKAHLLEPNLRALKLGKSYV